MQNPRTLLTTGFGALAALLMAGTANRAAALNPFQERKVARAAPTASWIRKGGKRVRTYPGQTVEQKGCALLAADAKRARRAGKATEQAERSARGYHPILQRALLRAAQ